MNESSLLQSLGQVPSSDASTLFRDHLRGALRQMICDVMSEEVVENFTEFVIQQTANERAEESKLPELFDLWLAQNLSDSDFAENVAAVSASINDFLKGERGVPAEVSSQDLRREFGLPKILGSLPPSLLASESNG